MSDPNDKGESKSIQSNSEAAQLILPSTPIRPVSNVTSAKVSEEALEPGTDLNAKPWSDEVAKQAFLWNTHSYLNEYSRFADTKAAFAGAISSGLLGALYSAKLHIPIWTTDYQAWSGITWCTLFAGLSLLVSVGLAIMTVWPRLSSSQQQGFIYWNSIAASGTLEVFMTSFHNQSPRTLNDHLLHHIFDIATAVTSPKYAMVSWCIRALSIGAILAAISLIGS